MRTFTLTLTKIVSNIKQPDFGKTVTIRDLAGNIIATASESPANSGQYIASFTEVERYGYWYVDGVVKNSYSNNSPFWLGNYDSLSGSTIKINSLTSNTISAITLSVNTIVNSDIAKQNQSNSFSSPQEIANRGSSELKFTETDSGDSFVLGYDGGTDFILGTGSALGESPLIRVDYLTGNTRVKGSLSSSTLSAGNTKVSRLYFSDGSSMTTAATGSGGGGIPYTGATANLNLGTYSLSATNVTASVVSAGVILNGSFQSITASFNTRVSGLETATGNLASGTAALQTQVGSIWNSKIPYTGASANVNIAAYGLTASSISSGGGITGTTISGVTLLVSNFQTSTASLQNQIDSLETATANLYAKNSFTSPLSISAAAGAQLNFTEINGGTNFVMGYEAEDSMDFIVGTGANLSTAPKIRINKNGDVKVLGTLTANTLSSLSAYVSGRLGVGTTTPHTTITMVNVSGIPTFTAKGYGGQGDFAGERFDGNPDIPASISTNEMILSFAAKGYDGTQLRTTALIGFRASENWVTTSSPSYIDFATTRPGQVARSEHMRITSTGWIGIGTTTPKAHLHVTGSISAQNLTAQTIVFTDGTSMTTASSGGSGAVSGGVPYTGATAGVNLGTYSLTANSVCATKYLFDDGSTASSVLYSNTAFPHLTSICGTTKHFALSASVSSGVLAGIGKKLKVTGAGIYNSAPGKFIKFMLYFGNQIINTHTMTTNSTTAVNNPFVYECHLISKTTNTGQVVSYSKVEHNSFVTLTGNDPALIIYNSLASCTTNQNNVLSLSVSSNAFNADTDLDWFTVEEVPKFNI